MTASINNSVDTQNQICSYGNGAALLVFKVLAYGRTDGRTDVCTDSNVTTRIFEIDGLPNFLKYGAPLAFGAQELRYRIFVLNYSVFCIQFFFFAEDFKI